MTKIAWLPQEGSQQLTLSCPCNHILVEGTRGGGKSEVQLAFFRRFVGIGYGSHWRGVIFDMEYKNLDDIVAKSKAMFAPLNDGAKFISSMSSMKWVWPTGEELLLRVMKDEKGYDAYHGHEYPFIAWNELTKRATDVAYLKMMSTNRSGFRPDIHSPNLSNPLPPIPLVVLSTTNPFGPGHCVDYGEVLTNKGWVDIKNMRTGDTVLTMDNNGESFYTEIDNVVCEEYEGTIVRRKGRGLTMSFTENHRLPHRNSKSFTVKPFTDLPGDASIVRACNEWNGLENIDFKLPMTKHKKMVNQPTVLKWDDYCELMGWFLSEGCTLERDHHFEIAQSKPQTRPIIKNLLDRCGFSYRCTSISFIITGRDWFNYMRQFGKCRDKYIPRHILDSSKDSLLAFYESAMLGDGCRRKGNKFSGIYYTTSIELADNFAELCVKLGLNVYISNRQRENRKGLSYAVNISPAKDIKLNTGNHVYDVSTQSNHVNVTRTPFKGNVYCITVPKTEVFFIRQNGCVWLSGNTWVKQRFIDPAPSGKVIKTETEIDDRENPGKKKIITTTQVSIFSSYLENKYLDDQYIADLTNIKDRALRKAWLYGDWNITSGGMFDDLWSNDINVLESFPIPSSWSIYRTFDWGSSAPFSVGWWAQSDGTDYIDHSGETKHTVRGDIFRIGEWYGWSGKPNEGLYMIDKDIAKGIVKMEMACGYGNRIEPGPADASIFAGTNGVCIAKNMSQNVSINGSMYPGVNFTKSNKAAGTRKIRWQLMRTLIYNARSIDGIRENPGMFVFRNCKDGFLRTVPSISRDQKDLEDIDTKSEDHVCDETGYFVLDTCSGIKNITRRGF